MITKGRKISIGPTDLSDLIRLSVHDESVACLRFGLRKTTEDEKLILANLAEKGELFLRQRHSQVEELPSLLHTTGIQHLHRVQSASLVASSESKDALSHGAGRVPPAAYIEASSHLPLCFCNVVLLNCGVEFIVIL